MKVPFWKLPGLLSECLEKRFRITLGDPGFFKHREFHLVGEVAKFPNLFLRAGILEKIVGRKPEHGKTSVAIFFLEGLKTRELRGEAAVTGGVDDQQHCIRVGITQPYRLFAGEVALGEIKIHSTVAVICAGGVRNYSEYGQEN